MIRYTVIDRPGKHDHVARWRNRCTYCGHRCTVRGVAPIETRRQPYRIPSEIVHRYLAMRSEDDRRMSTPVLIGLFASYAAVVLSLAAGWAVYSLGTGAI